ncbi:hypothetical protein [Streptomyces kanamyceticus]|uniref:Lipoprotein n=1 Tax=Streptomyces kanamyceticus TaxID=1967 RepID=A0A5J6GAS1_STRKN|nr:hypothetical protein [Streptomyces kanamyceticus]QEU92579.1 hypothetical protein CP970_18200 [Streptomyces kanamyceticus]
MNRSRIRPIAVSLAAAAALLLTACGGGGDENGGKKSESPRVRKSEAAGSDRPEMSLPSDVSLVFDKVNVTDPDQAAAMGNARKFVRAIRHGITKQDVDDPAYKFYSESRSPAQAYAKDQIEQRVDRGFSISGEMRFSRTKVSPAENEKSAVVSFCSDSSKLYSKEVKTEKVHRTEPSISDYNSWQVLMTPAKNSEGPWRAQKVRVEEKAVECR